MLNVEIILLNIIIYYNIEYSSFVCVPIFPFIYQINEDVCQKCGEGATNDAKMVLID